METPDIKWEELPFGYVPTDYNVRCTFKDGKWGEIEVSDSEYIPVHIAATCLHYGQESFEGLKAFRGKEGARVPHGGERPPFHTQCRRHQDGTDARRTVLRDGP